MSCYLYFFCLHCCLINIHIFDYPDSRLSGLFTEVPTSPDNRGSTVFKRSVNNFFFSLLVPSSFRESSNPNFTIKRMYDSAREEFEQLEKLREVSGCYNSAEKLDITVEGVCGRRP